ncbi:hypothetical protein MTO96_024011 [Rhipicephalus appendiculatus]
MPAGLVSNWPWRQDAPVLSSEGGNTVGNCTVLRPSPGWADIPAGIPRRPVRDTDDDGDVDCRGTPDRGLGLTRVPPQHERAMEKRLHNTRHAARQARNSGKASSTASNRTTSSGGASSATAERMTMNTTTSASPNSKATTSAPSPPPVAAASSANHHREQTSTPASSSRHRQQHQHSVKQSDSSDEDNEDNEDEEMEDDAASPSPPGGAGDADVTAVDASDTDGDRKCAVVFHFRDGHDDALRYAKTKTVTRKKYQRILKILKGEEQTSAENSKFRFWVKAKGFKMGLPPGHPQQSVHKAALAAAAAKSPPEQLLFVPCSKVKKGGDGETTVYKRVAVVENFFEIIYGVHVEMDGRGGKHAGQKRTYKAIAELYAFLPREATRKRRSRKQRPALHATPRVALARRRRRGTCSAASSPGGAAVGDASAPGVRAAGARIAAVSAADVDFSVPITTAYLKHMRSLGLSDEDAFNPREVSEDLDNNCSLSRIDA